MYIQALFYGFKIIAQKMWTCAKLWDDLVFWGKFTFFPGDAGQRSSLLCVLTSKGEVKKQQKPSCAFVIAFWWQYSVQTFISKVVTFRHLRLLRISLLQSQWKPVEAEKLGIVRFFERDENTWVNEVYSIIKIQTIHRRLSGSRLLYDG